MNNSLDYPRQRRIKVLVFSNYCLVRESLKELFEINKDIVVSQMVDLNFSAPGDIKLQPADVAVVYLEDEDSPEVIEEIQSALPDTRIVTVVNGENLDAQVQALKCGAAGVVKREQNFRFLTEAVRQTSKGEVWFNQGLLNKILNNRGKSAASGSRMNGKTTSVEVLTSRELEVIGMIGEGYKNKVIADKLSISEATVRHHLSSIYGKLGVDDRLNLVIVAYQKNLIQISRTGSGI